MTEPHIHKCLVEFYGPTLTSVIEVNLYNSVMFLYIHLSLLFLCDVYTVHVCVCVCVCVCVW